MMNTISDDIAAWRAPVRPSPPSLLEAAIACRRSGLSPSDGAPLLTARYEPDPHSLASIVAGVWNIGDDPGTIESALRACARWSEGRIADAVAAVAGRGGGMLVRSSPADTGMLPASGVGDSPDIIPVGAQPVFDPETRFGQEWGGEPRVQVIPGAVNHVYVRARNLFPGPETARVTLAAVTTPLLMRLARATPLRTSSGATSIELRASRVDQIMVGREPFLWTPPTDGSTVTIVARIETPHAVAIGQTDERVEGIAAWMAHHPGHAWRSMGLLDASPMRERTARLRFGNPGPDTGRFLLAVSCSGLPDGMKIRLRARLAGIDIGPAPVGCSSAGSLPVALTALVALPGWLEDDLIVELTDPDGTRLCTGSIDLSYYAVVGGEAAGDPVAAGFASPASLGISALGLGEGERLGLLGACRLTFQTVEPVTLFDPAALQFNTPDRRGEPTAPAEMTHVSN